MGKEARTLQKPTHVEDAHETEVLEVADELRAFAEGEGVACKGDLGQPSVDDQQIAPASPQKNH